MPRVDSGSLTRARTFDAFYLVPDPYRTRSHFPEQARLRRAWEWIGDHHYHLVLDFGAGECIWTSRLSAISDVVVATDISRLALTRARADYGTSLQYVVADLERVPFAPNSFDLVCCMTSLGCLQPSMRPSVIEQLAELLVPAGRLLFIDAIAPNRFARGQITQLLSEHFHILRVGAGNIRIPLSGRLATRYPRTVGRLYGGLTRMADWCPEWMARHVIVLAKRR
jgi:SAM-dependent methyltransferase